MSSIDIEMPDPLSPVEFDRSASDQAQGVRLDVSVYGRTGDVTVETEVSGKLGVGIGDAVAGFDRNTINIIYSPELPNSLESRVQAQLSTVQQVFSSQIPGIPTTAASILPSPGSAGPLSRGGLTVGRQLWTGVFGQHIAGESPVTHQAVANFEPVRIPSLDREIGGRDLSFDVSDLPPVRLEVEAKPTEAFQNAFGGLTGQIPSVEIEIPAAAFVQPVDISSFSCSELYPDISDRVESFRQNFSGVGGGVQSSIEEIQSVKQRLEELSSQYGQGASLENINVRRLILAGRPTLVELRNRVEKVNLPSEQQLNNFESSLSDLRSEVQSIEYPRCSRNFSSKLDNISNELSVDTSKVQNAIQTRKQILDKLSVIPQSPPDLGIQDCINRYPNIADRFNTLREDLQNAPTGDSQDIRGVLSRARQLKSDLSDNIPENSDCMDEFTSSIDSLIKSAEEKRGRIEVSFSVPECARQARGAMMILQDVSKDYQDVVSPTSNTTREDINQAISSTEAAIEWLNNSDKALKSLGLSCRDRVLSRVRNLKSQLEGMEPDVPEIDFGLGMPDCIGKDKVLTDMVEGVAPDIKDLTSMQGSPDPERVRSVRSDLSNIVEYINNTNEDQTAMSADCMSRAKSKVQEVDSQLESLLGGGNLDCSSVDRRIRNLVSGFESSAQTFVNMQPEQRSGEGKQELINQGTQLVTQVQNQVSSDNPCKDQLLSRIRGSLSSVRQASIPSGDSIPCESQYSGVNSDVSDFEESVSSLSRPVSASKVSSLINDGENVMQRINSEVPADAGCKDEMISRTRAALERLSDFTTQRSLRVDIPEGNGEAKNKVQDLRNRLNTVSARLGDN